MIHDYHNIRWVCSFAKVVAPRCVSLPVWKRHRLWHKWFANFLWNLQLGVNVTFYCRFSNRKPYEFVSFHPTFLFFGSVPLFLHCVFQFLRFLKSVSFPIWLRFFLSSAEQIDRGHWLAVERQLMASEERWEIK